MAPGKLQRRQCDVDLAIAVAHLVAHAVFEAMFDGGGFDPLQRLGIRADQQGIGMPLGD